MKGENDYFSLKVLNSLNIELNEITGGGKKKPVFNQFC